MLLSEIITEWPESARTKRYRSDGTTYKGKRMPNTADPVLDKAQSFSDFDPEEFGYEMQIDEPSDTAYLNKQIQKIIDTLPEKQRKVLTLRFGLYDTEPHSLEEIAKLFGVTRQRISQIEVRALRQLRYEHPDVLDKLRVFTENLRDWFGKGKKGGAGGGGWDRYNTKGERVGKCGDSKSGEGKPKCLSKSAAAKLRNRDADGDGKADGKKGIARAVNRKRSKDPAKNRAGAAKNVKN